MAKYRKKPIIVEAEQFDPHKHPWVNGVIPWSEYVPKDMSWGYIDTLEGRHHVMANDWIVTGIAGEKYPVKPNIFEATYELVHE